MLRSSEPIRVPLTPSYKCSVLPWHSSVFLRGIWGELRSAPSRAHLEVQPRHHHVLYMELSHLTGLQSPFSPVALVRLANVNHPSQFLETGDLFSSPFPGATTSQTTLGWDITQLPPKVSPVHTLRFGSCFLFGVSRSPHRMSPPVPGVRQAD